MGIPARDARRASPPVMRVVIGLVIGLGGDALARRRLWIRGDCRVRARTPASPLTPRRSLRRAVAPPVADRASSVERHRLDCAVRLDGGRHRSKHREPTVANGRYHAIGRKLYRRVERRAKHAVWRV